MAVRTGRPPKPAGELLFPVATNLPAREYEILCRVARARDVKLAALIRQIVVARLSQMNKSAGSQSLVS